MTNNSNDLLATLTSPGSHIINLFNVKLGDNNRLITKSNTLSSKLKSSGDLIDELDTSIIRVIIKLKIFDYPKIKLELNSKCPLMLSYCTDFLLNIMFMDSKFGYLFSKAGVVSSEINGTTVILYLKGTPWSTFASNNTKYLGNTYYDAVGKLSSIFAIDFKKDKIKDYSGYFSLLNITDSDQLLILLSGASRNTIPCIIDQNIRFVPYDNPPKELDDHFNDLGVVAGSIKVDRSPYMSYTIYHNAGSSDTSNNISYSYKNFDQLVYNNEFTSIYNPIYILKKYGTNDDSYISSNSDFMINYYSNMKFMRSTSTIAKFSLNRSFEYLIGDSVIISLIDLLRPMMITEKITTITSLSVVTEVKLGDLTNVYGE